MGGRIPKEGVFLLYEREEELGGVRSVTSKKKREKMGSPGGVNPQP